MTPFEFMVNSFCIAAGIIFLSIGVLIVLAIICGIYNGIKEMVLDNTKKDVSGDAEMKKKSAPLTAAPTKSLPPL